MERMNITFIPGVNMAVLSNSISAKVSKMSCQEYTPPPPCISYAKVPNQYGPYAYCSLDTGVACAQHMQLPKHT